MSVQSSVIAPFDERPGVWLRCALHAHTTETDGWLTPPVQRRYHAWGGYDVLAITDHWKRTEAPSTKQLLVLPSVELNCILPGARDGHVLGYGLSFALLALTLRELSLGLTYAIWAGIGTAAIAAIGLVGTMLASDLSGLTVGVALASVGFGLTRPGFTGGASLAVPLAVQP